MEGVAQEVDGGGWKGERVGSDGGGDGGGETFRHLKDLALKVEKVAENGKPDEVGKVADRACGLNVVNVVEKMAGEAVVVEMGEDENDFANENEGERHDRAGVAVADEGVVEFVQEVEVEDGVFVEVGVAS